MQYESNRAAGLMWSVVIALSAMAANFFAQSEELAPLRALVLFWFLLICPGMALVQLLGIQNRFNELVLAVALSLVLGLLVSVVILYSGIWSPPLILLILVGISIVGVIAQLYVWLSQHIKQSVGQN